MHVHVNFIKANVHVAKMRKALQLWAARLVPLSRFIFALYIFPKVGTNTLVQQAWLGAVPYGCRARFLARAARQMFSEVTRSEKKIFRALVSLTSRHHSPPVERGRVMVRCLVGEKAYFSPAAGLSATNLSGRQLKEKRGRKALAHTQSTGPPPREGRSVAR